MGQPAPLLTKWPLVWGYMLLQLFNPEEIQFCLDNSCEMQDGSKTKALTSLKKNEESVTIPDKIRIFVTS